VGRLTRGEIWAVAGGVYDSKPRPAVILQDDRFDQTSSLTVCPATTTEVIAPLLRMPLPADGISGLDPSGR
jgi:mRNA interferase MazF